MARLLRPVTKIMSVMPAAAASSTAYWISGLSTTGSISFGLALVAGRNRVPRPATGKTAVRIIEVRAIEMPISTQEPPECNEKGDRCGVTHPHRPEIHVGFACAMG